MVDCMGEFIIVQVQEYLWNCGYVAKLANNKK